MKQTTIEQSLLMQLAESIHDLHERHAKKLDKKQDTQNNQVNDILNYHGKDPNILLMLQKASKEVGAKQNHLELLMAFLSRKEMEHQDYIEKLMSDNERDREQVSQLSADIQDKEKRFRELDLEFKNFVKQLSQYTPDPVQQAQGVDSYLTNRDSMGYQQSINNPPSVQQAVTTHSKYKAPKAPVTNDVQAAAESILETITNPRLWGTVQKLMKMPQHKDKPYDQLERMAASWQNREAQVVAKPKQGNTTYPPENPNMLRVDHMTAKELEDNLEEDEEGGLTKYPAQKQHNLPLGGEVKKTPKPKQFDLDFGEEKKTIAQLKAEYKAYIDASPQEEVTDFERKVYNTIGRIPNEQIRSALLKIAKEGIRNTTTQTVVMGVLMALVNRIIVLLGTKAHSSSFIISMMLETIIPFIASYLYSYFQGSGMKRSFKNGLYGAGLGAAATASTVGMGESAHNNPLLFKAMKLAHQYIQCVQDGDNLERWRQAADIKSHLQHMGFQLNLKGGASLTDMKTNQSYAVNMKESLNATDSSRSSLQDLASGHGSGKELRTSEYNEKIMRRERMARATKEMDMQKRLAKHHENDGEQDYANVGLEHAILENLSDSLTQLWESEAWQKSSGKSKSGGLNDKGIASYRASHPGSHLQKAVTTKPSKLKPGSKAAKRRKSFCARMSGNKGPMKKPNGKPTRKALALRKWHCESLEQMAQLIQHAEQEILLEKWSAKYKGSINCSHPKGFSQKAHCAGKKKHNESVEMEMTCPDCGMCETHGDHLHQNLDEACWKGYHKEGTKKMFGKRYPNCVKNAKESVNESARVSRKPGQPAKSKAHSDLYTDEDPKGTIHGLKFATTSDAHASVSKIKQSSSGHAHKIQAAVAMEQRARAAGKTEAAAVYRSFINSQKKNKVNESAQQCPHCGGAMFSELMMNEKQDACYYKVKSRYKVWPSAYASGALVRCRKKGASNWGNKSESTELDENLHDWFHKEKWVRMDTKGNIKGDCAREPGEGKPKCLPAAKAHALGKTGRASAAQRKRRQDPNPDRQGAAINVATKKSHNEGMSELHNMIASYEQMINEIAKGAKDSNGVTKCWPGKHAEGFKKGRNGGKVRNCVPNEGQ